MEPDPPPLRADPDFRPGVAERSLPSDPDPGAVRRILANPYLGLLGLGLWLALLRLAVLAMAEAPQYGYLLIPLAGAGLLIPRLFQYHCLDCGATGRLSRWRRHVCPSVARRLLEGRSLRFRGPSPMVQVLLWLYLLGAVMAAWSALPRR